MGADHGEIFDEIYGEYYHAVAEILRQAASEPVNSREIRDIADAYAFSESFLTIEEKLKANGDWPLIDEEGYSLLGKSPAMPLTLLQKSWLKALLSDPRIRLFDVSEDGLTDAGIKPLYHSDIFVYYDRYSDGDPFKDEEYIKNFRTVHRAIRESRSIRFDYELKNGGTKAIECIPYRLEYSAKDDKFRLLGMAVSAAQTYNMSKVRNCELLECRDAEEFRTCGTVKHNPATEMPDQREVEFFLKDQRDTLERVMLQFSHYEKVTERVDDESYKCTLRYAAEDEPELLIQILSFGPNLKVTGPDGFVRQIKARLRKQKLLSAADSPTV